MKISDCKDCGSTYVLQAPNLFLYVCLNCGTEEKGRERERRGNLLRGDIDLSESHPSLKNPSTWVI